MLPCAYMQTFIKYTLRPGADIFEEALWIADYFAPGHYGVQFRSGKIVDPFLTPLKTTGSRIYQLVNS